MMKRFLVVATMIALNSLACGEDGPVAYWAFEEGSGDVLHDRSGSDNHGKIHGARWVRSGGRSVLLFDGVNDYVDCGKGASLDLRGPLTLEAWIHPHAPPAAEPGVIGKSIESYAITFYKNGSAYFYIAGGGNGVSAAIKVGQWSHIAGVFDGGNLRFYVNGSQVAANATKFPQAKPGHHFFLGCVFGDPTNPDVALRNTAFFAGMLDAARVFNRALGEKEIADHFNELAIAKDREPLDTSNYGELLAESFLYPERQQAVLEVNYRWIRPLPKGARVRVELLQRGKTNALQNASLKLDSPRDVAEASFSLQNLAAGEYTLRAALVDSNDREHARAEQTFTLPVPIAEVPSPTKWVAQPLPTLVKPPKYRFELARDGGFLVTVNGRKFPVESSFSYPQGGENALAVSPPSVAGEADWKITTRKVSSREYAVHAEGAHYAIDRTIRLTPTRIEIADTITNKTADVLGIIFSNHINTRGLEGARNTVPANPSVFVAQESSGLGLLALDDVYQLHQRTRFSEDRVEIRDEHFGLAKGASYTVEWAAYPTASDDYFDFINAVRKDEGLHGHVEGALELTSRWGPPPREIVERKALRYASVCYLTHSLQNPHASIEGWEFLAHPELCERIKKTIAESKAACPEVRPLFHVAPTLYSTATPLEQFGDSVMRDIDGKLDHYGPNTFEYYGNYVARELFDKGWRWWVFIPTLENSFGKWTLKAADYYLDELGATALWSDGFITGYVKDNYTYDRWDGHSVTIDPKTKLVTRKKAHATFLMLPVLKATTQKFREKGATLFSNDVGPPRSLWREPMINSCETSGGDQQPIASLHLAQTVTALGNPTAIQSERDLYLDMLTKLDLGALYFWYGERDFVKQETLVSRMYPITFESIHAGTVRGRERIVTKKSGVYGWPGDHDLHLIHHCDARGQFVAHSFLTTADRTGLRTELALKQNESAVVEKIPLQLQTSRPANLLVTRYEAHSVEIRLSSTGKATLSVRGGRFPIQPLASYRVTTDREQTIAADKHGTLTVPLDLRRTSHLKIDRQ